ECIGDGEGDGREDGDEGFAGGGGGDGAQSPESMLFDSGIVPVGSSGTKGRRSFFALNEIALTRGPDGRVIEFTFGISDASIARIRGDGLVVATATGSSAYALSAGGPLASPDFQGMIVVPVAPHTLAARPIITASHDVVEIDLRGSRNIRSAVLFVDGEPLGFESPPARIWVRLGKEPTQLLRYKRQGFYEHAAQVFFK
ncbi:MAG: hypothetical protein FWE65_04090, partial [Eggerthellaceae bacterium]|nr:hypothetical protein [Eggerthellaceae bacterium]